MVVRLRRRPDFLAVAAAGYRWQAPAFVLQAGPRSTAEGDRDEIGLGLTASRRVGVAVARNRARRRLRAAAQAVLPAAAKPGFDYVIVARSAVLTCPFERLVDDLRLAFARVTERRRPRASRRPPAGRAGR